MSSYTIIIFHLFPNIEIYCFFLQFQPVADQKLIYSGQLLNDSLQLKDVLRSYKDVYTHNHIFHLVYTPKQLLNTTNLNQKSKSMTGNSNAAATAGTTDGLRQRHTTATATSTAQNVNSQTSMEQNEQQQQQQQFGFSFAGMSQPCPTPSYDGSSNNVFGYPQFNMQAMATQQAAMHAWMQQVYAQYMEQCLRL